MSIGTVAPWPPEIGRKGAGFLPAVAVSLAVHAALLSWLPSRHVSDTAPTTTLLASLRLPPASAAGNDAHPPTTSAAPARAPEVRRPQAMGAVRPEHPLPTAAAPTMSAASDATTPAAAPSPIEASAAAPSRVATLPASEALDTGALERYGRDLSTLLARQQQYPRVAAMRGWEGDVQLRLRIARKGNIVAVEVLHSSGFDVLDQHALQLVQQTSPLPPLPENLQGGDVQITVPVHYKLQKPT